MSNYFHRKTPNWIVGIKGTLICLQLKFLLLWIERTKVTEKRYKTGVENDTSAIPAQPLTWTYSRRSAVGIQVASNYWKTILLTASSEKGSFSRNKTTKALLESQCTGERSPKLRRTVWDFLTGSKPVKRSVIWQQSCWHPPITRIIGSLRSDDGNVNDNATNQWFDWLNEEK